MRIANKISLAFLLTAAVLAGIASPISYFCTRDNLKDGIYAHLQTTAQSRANHIETFLKEHLDKAKLVADSLTVELALEAITGQEQPSSDLLAEITGELKEILAYDADVYEIFVLDPEGRVFVSTDQSKIGLDKSADACFQAGRQGPCVEDAYYSQATGKKALTVSAPVRDDQTQELRGVVVVQIELTNLAQITADRTGLGHTGEIYLVNRSGYMITPSRFKEDTFLKQKVDTEDLRDCVSTSAHPGGPQTCRPPSIFTDYRGVRVLGTHVHIPRMQWCLVAEIDESEALRPLWQLKLLLVVLACVTPVMAWIIGNVASRLITRPIEVLQKGIKVVGAGNLDHNVGTNATDEIGQLSRAFDQMTCDLRRTTTSIDELNKEIVERKQAQERIEKLNLLQASLLDTGDLEAKLKRITDSVVDIFDADFCRIWLTGPGDLCDSGCIHAQTNQGPHVCDSRDRCLHLLASSGRYVHIDGEMHRRVPFGAYKIGRVAAGQDHKFLTNDVANDPRIHNHQWAKELGLVSFAGYQLCPPGGKTVGVLAVFAKHAISPMEDALLESLGNVIVQVIQTAEAEKEVQQQKEFLENVIEALSHPFYVIDVEDYTLKLANSAACANGILEGDTCHRVTHETDTPCRGEDHPCPLKEVKKTKKSMITEHIHYDADGQARHFEVHGHPVFDGRGNVAQVIEYSLDITERKRAEDTLKQTLADLERFNRLAVGRELRMIELKREVNDMAERAEIEPPYDLVFAEDTQSTF